MAIKMSIVMPIGEIVDRYSICKLKLERTNVDCLSEVELLVSAMNKYKDIEIYIDQLYEINGSIWDLEGEVRRGKEGKLGLEEVGRRALKIRNFNGMRVSIKNKINSFYKEGFKEIKSNHASE